jgi:hypothetical protein
MSDFWQQFLLPSRRGKVTDRIAGIIFQELRIFIPPASDRVVAILGNRLSGGSSRSKKNDFLM